MRDGFKYLIAAVAGSIVLSAPAVAIDKIHSAGQVTKAVVQETGDAVNSGMTEVQGIGTPTTVAGDPTATTAPPVASGRP